MASPFKKIAQIKLFGEYSKLTKQVVSKIGAEPVKVQYFPKFKFEGREGPLVLFGDIPTPLMMEVKAVAGAAPVIGSCQAGLGDVLEIEGAVKAAALRTAFTTLSITRKVVSPTGDDGEETPKKGLESDDVKPGGKLPVWPPKPENKVPVPPPKVPPTPPKQVTPPPPQPKPNVPVPPPKVPPPQKVMPPLPPVPPPKVPPPSQKPTAQTLPKAPPVPQPPGEKDIIVKQMKEILPLFQKACDLPGAPVDELQKLHKQAGQKTLAGDFGGAKALIGQLENLVTLTLAGVKPSGNAKELEPEIEGGEFTKSRKAWRLAMREANSAISTLQAAVLKTKDSRAAGLASGFRRILTKMPNPGSALELAALAKAKGDREALTKHKNEISRLAKACLLYVSTDRLTLLAIENPFVPVKLSDFFKSALQAVNSELN